MDVTLEPARPEDAAAIAAIFNDAIDERVATFETRPQSPERFAARIADSSWPVLVARDGAAVIGWAALSRYSDHHYYGKIAEASVYVAAAARGRGVGTRLVEAIADAARAQGIYKLLGKIFTTNETSIRLVERCGFRTVGVHRRHGKLDDEWRDVVLVERLLDE